MNMMQILEGWIPNKEQLKPIQKIGFQLLINTEEMRERVLNDMIPIQMEAEH